MFKPKLAYKVVETLDNGKKVVESFSALLCLAGTREEPGERNETAFHMIYQDEKDVDLLDKNGKTLLNRAVLSDNEPLAKRLLEYGANPDHAYESEKRVLDKEKEHCVMMKNSPLYDAVNRGYRDMVKLLLEYTDDVNLDSTQARANNGQQLQRHMITVATDLCLKKRSDKVKLGILRDVVAAGAFMDIVDPITQRNALHNAVNSSSDSADQSLDLEIALLRNKCDIFAKDVRDRFPLHYAFVKVGKHTDHSRMDPIEVCSMIVEAMDSNRVDEPDEFGSTPLHYAAWRGATVCCLLLLQVINIMPITIVNNFYC